MVARPYGEVKKVVDADGCVRATAKVEVAPGSGQGYIASWSGASELVAHLHVHLSLPA